MALFKSKSQRILKKARDMAADDMVDQAAVLIEEEIEGILEEKDTSRQVVPFLMDIGHPDLAARLSERIIKAHSDLRPGVVKMLEEKLSQFSRSTELLKVLWRLRLRSKDYNGMLELLSTVDRLTESRFTDSIESAYQAQARFPGEELKNTEPSIAMAVVLYRKGRPSEAVDVLVSAAERSPFPDESLARLSGWIANRTGGNDMDVNLGRIRILVALSDNERALSELSTLLMADREIIEKAIAITEKSLIPADGSGKASVALARLMSAAGRTNDACSVLEAQLEREVDPVSLEQAVAGVVLGAPGSARANLLQARLRISRGETTQGMESLTKVFECADLDQAPVAEVCRSVIEKGMDKDGRVTRRLGEFLVEKGSVEDAVQIILYLLEQDPDWVFNQIQKLLQKDKSNASVLILLAVHKLLGGREGEAGAALQHLATRKDLKSRSDMSVILSRLNHLMVKFPRLRRFRASISGGMGDSKESASDWLALLLSGEKVSDAGLLEIIDNGYARGSAREILESGFTPATPTGYLVQAVAAVTLEDAATASPAMAEAAREPALASRVADLVSDMRLSLLHKTSAENFLPALNDSGRGDVVAKLLPLLAEPGARADWMDSLATRVDTGDPCTTAFFRLEYFIEEGRFGTAAVSVENIDIPEGPVASLAAGCRATATGDRAQAVSLLSASAGDTGTAPLARKVLESMADEETSGDTTLALANSLVNTGDLSGAAGVLAKCLDSPDVKAFLEEKAPDHVESWELWKLLALSRLHSKDVKGFRSAASTALERDPAPAAELSTAAIGYGSEKRDAGLLLFGASIAVRHSTGQDVADAACDALRIDPGLFEQVAALELPDPRVRALLGIVSSDSRLFHEAGAPSDIQPPVESVEQCIEQWSTGGLYQPLHSLIKTCAASGLPAQAHAIRVALAGRGYPEIDEELFEDARSDDSLRLDFWTSVVSDGFIAKGLAEFLPPGIGIRPDEAGAAAAALARSSLDGETVMGFAMRLADSGDADLSAKSALLVDRAVSLPESKATLGFIRLLVAAGRPRDAFEAARGDDTLLAELRESIANAAKPAPSDEDSLWGSGRREAACAGWLARYRSTGDPVHLERLRWAFAQMGLPMERAALERFLQERHPGLFLAQGADHGRGHAISDLLLDKWKRGRGMTNGR
jgi:tetratricopeptide (TPR) repeat protein